MKRIILFCILLPLSTAAQVISLVAGSGSSSSSGIPATTAQLDNPNEIAFDRAGNLYFCEVTTNKIKKIDSLGILYDFAGTGVVGYSGDGGQATNAKLFQASGLAVDTSGNILIADAGNNVLRKVDVSSGIITTICGNGTAGFSGDGGPASAALLDGPSPIHFDKANNLYISCGHGARIRKIDASGVIHTIAGNGTIGYTGDGGPATAAKIIPGPFAIDDYGNLFFTTNNYFMIRKISASGIISFYAGDSTYTTYNGDGIPATAAHFTPGFIAFGPDRKLYFTDVINNRVRMVDGSGIINTVVGKGIADVTGDGGRADSATLYRPSGLAFDSCGNMYISSVMSPRIRKVTYPHCGYLNVPQITNGSKLQVFPNPATDVVHINGLSEPANYRLLDIVGRVMKIGKLDEGANEMSLTSASPGVYFLEITVQDKRVMKRIIKE